MAGDGVVLRDLHDGPGPTAPGVVSEQRTSQNHAPAVSSPAPTGTSHTLDPDASMSHALATASVTGGAVEANAAKPEDEVKDLGWHDADDEIENPLVGGLPNEELWVLIRRFNKARFS